MIHPVRAGRVVVICLAGACAAAALAQPQGPARPAWRDVLRDLAGRLAASVSSAEPFDLSVAVPGSSSPSEVRSLEAEMTAVLAARNLRPSPRADANTHVLVSCSESLQGRLCTAEVSKAGATTVLFAQRAAQPAAGAVEPRPLTALTMQPLLAQQAPLLDVVEVDPQHVLALDVAAVTLFERAAAGWTARQTKPLGRTGAWPRDVRGRLTVEGGRFEVFLPGRSCRGTLDPFDLACSEGRVPWPLGMGNDGLADGRNFFTSPKLPAFYSVAPVAQPAAEPGWLLATVEGGLRLIDSRLRAVATVAGQGDDLVALSGECAACPVVLVADAADHGDGLRAFEIVNGALAPLTAPASLPGELRALWPARDGAALAIVYDNGLERYEAFLVRLACAR